jgi:UDP-N-acetylglucosamine 1-carboxyvinyltransferase
MEKFRIRGGRRLAGEVRVSGAKNAALPCLAATLLTSEPVRLQGLPRVRDIVTMEKVLAALGESCERENGTTRVVAGSGDAHHAPYELVRTMRASVLVLGPLLARRRRARVSLPGGCAIGARPVDFHLQALARLGADLRVESGDVVAEAPHGLAGAEIEFPRITVTGTENLLMAAVLARGRTVLRNCAREPEVEDLAAMLAGMGARIAGVGSPTLEVEGVEALRGTDHTIIPDRIEAGTYVIAAVLAGAGVTVTGCRPAHLHALLDLLERAGVAVETSNDAVTVPEQGSPPRAVSATTAEYPGFATDLQAQLLALATQSRGTSNITEAIFENRFQHVLELKRMGAAIDVEGRTAHVHGSTPLDGTTVMASDLRASATLVLAGLVARGDTVVDRIYHLDRGYEAMEVKLNALGAEIERFNPGPYR